MDESLELIWRCPGVIEVIGASLIPWHVLIASQLAGVGKWHEQNVRGRVKNLQHSAAAVKLQEVSTCCPSAVRSVSPSL